jgi:hypothetical protein
LFRLDWFGRRILSGYGFTHIPLQSGSHFLQIPLWRPCGNSEQELRAFLMGDTPCLLSSDPIYESAWKERCRLLTTSAGSIALQINIITRFMKDQGIA